MENHAAWQYDHVLHIPESLQNDKAAWAASLQTVTLWIGNVMSHAISVK
jgi:hypothetical protein